MMNWRFQLCVCLGAVLVVGCLPTSAPPSAPPAELALPAARPVELPAEPPLPEIPPAPMGPRGPNELMLPVVDEVSAEELGAIERLDGALPRLNLTLEPCRFSPSEDGSVSTAGADHCRRANQVSFGERSQRALLVTPGRWEIAVENAGFDRELGFWLRPESAQSQPVVSAGGIARGATRVWTVDLTPGRYVYSCPLSPTPDYLLVVR